MSAFQLFPSVSRRHPFRKLPHRASDYGAPGSATAGESSPAADAALPGAGTAPTALDHFRARSSRRPLHPKEKLLLWLVGTQLVFLPWGFGGMRLWAQIVSAVFSVVIFAVALLPRDSLADDGTALRLNPARRLIRFPIFWLGLAFLAYAVIGALNPAWRWVTNGTTWWMTRIAHVEWLPSGVRVPFSMWGPWRTVLIDGSVWLTVCAVWIGLTRRKSFRALFTTLVINGFVMAIVGLIEEVHGNGKVLWLFKNTTGYFVVTIPYKNHAAAYFNLILAIAAGLAFWHYARSLRRFEKSSPAPLFAFAAVALATLVAFSFSRAGTILMVVFMVVAAVLFLGFELRLPAAQRNRLTMALGAAVVGCFIVFATMTMNFQQVTVRIEQLLTTEKFESIEMRELAWQATFDMGRAQPVYGWGAGSFRFLFPLYQQHYQAIFHSRWGRLYWEHAHNDYAEFFAEYGAVGIALALVVLGYGLIKYLRSYAWQNPIGLFVGLGLLITLLHAWVDFQFHNPAIQTTWAVLLFGVIRWAQLEERARG